MEIWIVAFAAAALLGRAGLAFYACGLVRAKNAGGSMVRHLADLCIAALAFWALGIAVTNPGGQASALQARYLFGLKGPEAALLAPRVFLMLAATLLGTGIVVGSLAERCRFWPSIAPSLLLGGLVIPMLSRWCAPLGWLGRMHFHDEAGASFIHVAAGCCAAVGAIVVGPRDGKYNRDASTNVIPGHSLPLACGGAWLILVAWFPYLLAFSAAAGHSAGLVALNALLAAAAAGFAALVVSHLRYGKPDIYLTFSGVLGGLVAVTAAAGTMSNLAAFITGTLAGVIIPVVMLQVDLVWRIDDPTGALAIHGIGGGLAVIAAGFFAPVADAGGRLHFLGIQMLGLLVAAATTVALSFVVFAAMNKSIRLRAREEDEFDGLDLAEHDIGSYPDFQQTTIKSYHLREA